MRIEKIASSAEYRIDEQSLNLSIFRTKFLFSKLEKNSISFFIFQFGKFQKFPKFSNFENHQIFKINKNNKISEIVIFRKLVIFKILKFVKVSKFQNLPIFGAKFWFSKLRKNSIVNFLIFQFEKFQQFPKFYNFEN